MDLIKGAEAVKPMVTSPSSPRCPVRRLIDLGDDLPRLFQKLSSGRRQPDVAVIALQKQRPHLLLQDLDLLAQRRLGDVELLRGAAKMQRRGHLDKIA